MAIPKLPKPAAAALLALNAVAAAAQEAPPQLGRFMPWYPGMYLDASYARDDRDASYTQEGEEVDTAVPMAGGHTAFPEQAATVALTWHFPMFESYALPFVSSRTHLARVTFRYVDTETEGALATFLADPEDDAATDADALRNNGSGIGDLLLEFGSFLHGSAKWREREATPLAVLALIGVNLPFGVYDRDAPINAGSNTAFAQVKLGLHWRPWSGGFVDAGGGWREYFQNYEPQFGALAPANQGDDWFGDVSLGQRVLPGLYLAAFATHRRGQENLYENPRFAPNAPAQQGQIPLVPADNFPTPGNYRDEGTELTTVGASVQYFVTQRWLVALHYTVPTAGQSGQLTLPFTNRQPAGCTIPSTGCTTSDGEAVIVDGLGPARTYASDRLALTVTYNFGLGDPFMCPGCER